VWAVYTETGEPIDHKHVRAVERNMGWDKVTANKIATQFMADVDENQDGVVDREEFSKFIKINLDIKGEVTDEDLVRLRERMNVSDIINPAASQWYARANTLFSTFGEAPVDRVRQLAVLCGLADQEAHKKARTFTSLIKMVGASAKAKETMFVDWLQEICAKGRQLDENDLDLLMRIPT